MSDVPNRDWGGLSLRRDELLEADVRVSDQDIDLTAPRLHSALFGAGLEEMLLEAIEEIPGDRQGEMKAALLDVGVDALDGMFAEVAVSAAAITRWARQLPEGDDRIERAERARQELVDVARQLGTGTPLGFRSSRDDLTSGPVSLFQATESHPVIEVTLTAEFASRRCEQRREVLEFLLELGMGCDVAIVATGQARRCLNENHRDQLPGHLTEACNPRTSGGPPAGAAAALGSLEREGTGVAMLKALSEVPSGSLSYADLRRELCLETADDSLVAQTAKRLEEEHGLAERLERPDGTMVLSLRPEGLAAVELQREDEEIRRKAATSWSTGEPDDSTPKILPPCRVFPREVGRGEDGESAKTASAAESRPDAEGSAATEEQPYAEGWVDVEYMSRSRHVAAATAVEPGELGLVDAELPREGDGRRPYWSYNAERDELAVGAEYHNPMQMWVTIARSLASEKTLQDVLTADRLGENLEGLETADMALLRDARCIGWLSDDATGKELVEELREAREQLLEKTSDLRAENYDDRDDFRSEILQLALGLAGTIVHLLDLLDVEVVREIRVPEYSRHFSRDDRRGDLARTIATGAAIQSHYGHFAAFRQLFEEREEKRETALNPDVDPTDAVGSLVGSIVLVGDGIDGLEEELAAHLDRPRELHPDAPEFGVCIPIREASRSATARATQRLLSTKQLKVTREAVDLLHGFASDVYAVVAGLNRGLNPEAQPREIHLDEVRLALATLDENQLLPEASQTARKGVAALLEAERPLSQAELARRAGISTQSWRNHREALADAGVVQEGSEGWRVCLPFREERWIDVEDVLPWYLLDDPEKQGATSRELRKPLDVLYEFASDWMNAGRASEAVEAFVLSGKWPPDEETVQSAIADLGLLPVWKLIRAGAELENEPSPSEVTMGWVQPVQKALPTG